ncbi:hypothetical protein NO1_0641 [Candidatus Termititenax aidoneus]|uniref:Uncharacterized protein n=1 Tax=Termititenax aidoneus TaxID=2218524 RepID=A0A388TAG0_TERA1|nr:hypothetical protein NO1_0641 [Candidatus Termititenax aidoneus]
MFSVSNDNNRPWFNSILAGGSRDSVRASELSFAEAKEYILNLMLSQNINPDEFSIKNNKGEVVIVPHADAQRISVLKYLLEKAILEKLPTQADQRRFLDLLGSFNGNEPFVIRLSDLAKAKAVK